MKKLLALITAFLFIQQGLRASQTSDIECKATAAVLALAESKQTSEKLVTRAQKLKPLLYDMLTTLPMDLIKLITSYDYEFEGKELICRVNHKREKATAIIPVAQNHIAIGTNKGTIKIWDLESGACINTFQKNPFSIKAIQCSIGKGILLSHHDEPFDFGGITFEFFDFWNMKSGECVEYPSHMIPEEERNKILLILYPNASLLASYPPACCKLQIEDKSTPCNIQYSTKLDDIEKRPRIITYALVKKAQNNSISLWLSENELQQLHGHSKEIKALAQLPDGNLASGSLDGTVRIWDLETGTCQKIIQTMQPVYHLAVTEDGKLVVCFRSGSFQVFA